MYVRAACGFFVLRLHEIKSNVNRGHSLTLVVACAHILANIILAYDQIDANRRIEFLVQYDLVAVESNFICTTEADKLFTSIFVDRVFHIQK